MILYIRKKVKAGAEGVLPERPGDKNKSINPYIVISAELGYNSPGNCSIYHKITGAGQ
jgi:uncharacterized membrane protein YagU involved in acid resistance